MNDDDTHIPDKHKVTQTDANGEVIVIKDPIYDIMSDEELDTATNRLISLIESDEEETAESKKESDEA